MSGRRTCYTAFLNADPTSTSPAQPGLITPFADDEEPLLTVALVAEREGDELPSVASTLGWVDSGAHRSLFPLAIAARLGLIDDLIKDPAPAGGVGSVFETWTSAIPIKGQVIAFMKNDEGIIAPTPWGPAFDMRPGFAAVPQMLLGRADFFKAFNVEFCEDEEEPGDCFRLTPR